MALLLVRISLVVEKALKRLDRGPLDDEAEEVAAGFFDELGEGFGEGVGFASEEGAGFASEVGLAAGVVGAAGEGSAPTFAGGVAIAGALEDSGSSSPSSQSGRSSSPPSGTMVVVGRAADADEDASGEGIHCAGRAVSSFSF